MVNGVASHRLIYLNFREEREVVRYALFSNANEKDGKV